MKKHAIIYLHGFNSASIGLDGKLLINKEKLRVMQEFCAENDVVFFTPNVDYRDFQNIVKDLLFEWNQYLDQGYDVVFMGSSMGGFTSEYLAMKTVGTAIMINPAISPSKLLRQFIDVTENYETGQPYHWEPHHCDQYLHYEQELANSHQQIDRTILLDTADELIDSEKTRSLYDAKANVVAFEGGSHSFEHMRQALPVIERAIFS